MSDNEIVQEGNGYRAVLEYDDDPREGLSPRDNDGNVGIMWCRHPRYDLGDTNNDVFAEVGAFVDEMLEWHHGEEVTRAVVKHLIRHYKATVVRPLYLYDHSGLSLSAGANLVDNQYDTTLQRRRHFVGDYGGWDTSYIGFVFDTEESRADVTDAAAQIESEVDVYDDYLQGQVYVVSVERQVVTTITKRDPKTGELVDEDEFEDDWDEVESCGGFIGHKHAEEQAREMLKGYLTPA